MICFALLILTNPVLGATEKEQFAQQWKESGRCIEILPCVDINFNSELDPANDYGETRFFRTIRKPQESEQQGSAAAASQPSARETVEEQPDKIGFMFELYEYHKHYLAGASERNPLLVECEFFASPDPSGQQVPCGKIHMGLFMSGSDKLIIDKSSCKQIDEAKQTLKSFSFLRSAKDDLESKTKLLAGQRDPSDGPTPYYQVPIFRIESTNFPPISEGDLNEHESVRSHKDRVIFRLADALLRKQNAFAKLFGHASQDAAELKGCFEGNFGGCFTDSEQAWLDFLENPRPHHIFFSPNFDIQNAKTFQVRLFSYYDICRYCRGTLSYLFGSKYLNDLFFSFFKKLPDLMQPHWDRFGTQKQVLFPSGVVDTGEGQKDKRRAKSQRPESAAAAMATTPVLDTKEAVRFPERDGLRFTLTGIQAYSLDRISDEPRGQLLTRRAEQ